MQEIILVIVSIVAGLLGSLLGLGGGFIIVPVLSFMNISPSQIASTSLFSVLSTSSSSSIAYAKQKRIDYGLALRLSIFAIPGSILGAYLSNLISLDEFKLYFAFILLGTSVYMMYGIHKPRRILMILAYPASFFAGVLSSLFGIGGGVVYMPLMIGLLSLSTKTSSATTQFILFLSSLTGILTHVYFSDPDYLLASILVIGTFTGAQIGARISLTIREEILKKMVSIALIVIAMRMIISVLLE
ncbi:MAG: sulfite exporter TauE/SafE family protein [Candidatus Nitrosocaldaceae archaeon]